LILGIQVRGQFFILTEDQIIVLEKLEKSKLTIELDEVTAVREIVGAML